MRPLFDLKAWLNLRICDNKFEPTHRTITSYGEWKDSHSAAERRTSS
jgi:hypothetical protein